MKISVITVCFNAERFIERCINSVLQQSYPYVEYLVIDGKSIDSTLPIIEKYRDRIDCLVSESDEGIYDAMNKGIRAATGDFIFFLNADDFFVHPGILDIAATKLQSGEADLYYGDLLILGPDGKVRCEDHSDVDRFGIFLNFPTMPSLFYRKSVFGKVGLFSTDFRIVSDYFWIVSAFIESDVNAIYIDMAVTVFQIGGVSTNVRYQALQKQEKNQVRKLFFDERNWAVYRKIIKRRRKYGFFGQLLERMGIKIIALKRGAF